MDKLIEEISALKYPIKEIDAFDNDEIRLVGLAHNSAIDNVLELLESHKPKELDTPDSDGGWWFIPNYATAVFDIEYFYINVDVYNKLMIPTSRKGKWIKANPPWFQKEDGLNV